MIVKTLTLKGFRNHEYLTYEFSPGLNVITGPNGAGKTNVVEALYYLSIAKSFRINDGEGLVKKGKRNGEIYAEISEGSITRKIRIVLTPDDHQISINNKASRVLELAKVVNVILFEPKDVLLFRDSPRNRRNFLDVSLAKKSFSYLECITRYNKVLKERNELLKAENVDKTLLETTTEMLVKLSGTIVTYRQMYVKDINDILNKITRALTGEENQLEIIYKPFVENSVDFQSKALEAFKKAEEGDLRRKVTSIGVHREDFSVNLNGRDIGEYGSQGENRLAALALKLSPYFLIEDRDKRPIIVLDDVMSELDQNNRLRLITFLKKFEQVFITATRLEVNGANHYQIKKKKKEVF